MKKYFILFMVVFILSAFSVNIGTPKTVNEKQMIEDLQSYMVRDDHLMIIDRLTINERRTDKKNNTDTVYVTVDASDSETSCTVDIQLTYYLYEQGWRFKDWRQGDTSPIFHPLVGVSLEEADLRFNDLGWKETEENFIEGYYIGNTIDLENNLCTFEYSYTTEAMYRTQTGIVTLEYRFDTEEGYWYFSNYSFSDQQAQWNTGTWTENPLSYDDNIFVEIKDVGSDYIWLKIEDKTSFYNWDTGESEIFDSILLDEIIPFNPISGLADYLVTYPTEYRSTKYGDFHDDFELSILPSEIYIVTNGSWKTVLELQR